MAGLGDLALVEDHDFVGEQSGAECIVSDR
jgi:hypothetical protein